MTPVNSIFTFFSLIFRHEKAPLRHDSERGLTYYLLHVMTQNFLEFKDADEIVERVIAEQRIFELVLE